MKVLFHSVLSATLFALCGQVSAQAWPVKPVRFVLSQPAGSSPDIVARLVADRLSRAWGQAVIVDNRPGGQNVIGAQAAARAPADGYNFYYGTTAALVINKYTLKTMPYDPDKDFVPVGIVGMSAFVIAVHPGFPAKTLQELIALAKAEPGKVSMATEGHKTFGGMIGEMLQVTAGVKFLHVPYSGVGPGIQDTVAGRTQITVQSGAAVMRFVTGGQLRPLAVSGRGRVPELPDVPTVSASYPGFEYEGWHALVAPTGTPSDVIRRVNRDMDQVLKDPEIVKRLADLGSITEGAGTPESLGQYLAAEHARWAKLVKDVGIKPE